MSGMLAVDSFPFLVQHPTHLKFRLSFSQLVQVCLAFILKIGG